MSPVNDYDSFQMRSASINKPSYNSRAQVPTYKAGGEVARPKSIINGRRIRSNYENLTPPTHPDFYPIYGPQGEKRMYTPTKREKPERLPKEKPPKQPREEPRQYYRNEPDTRDKYKSEPTQKDSYPDRQFHEKPVKQNNNKNPEVVQPYQSKLKKRPDERPSPRREREQPRQREESPVAKNRETPEKSNRRQEPVILEPYQSKLKKRPEERKKIQQRTEEPLVHKEHETPQRNNARPEPVILEPYQSKLKKKPLEQKVMKQRTEEVRRDEQPVYKEHETPQRQHSRSEPVIIEPYRSKLKKKYVEPKQKTVEVKKEEHQAYTQHETPQQKNNPTEPYIIEPYQSKLKKRLDVAEKNKKNEEIKTKQKLEEKVNREPENEFEKENPESIKYRQDPVITELYRSKLKEKRKIPVKEKEQKLEERNENKENDIGHKDKEIPTHKKIQDPIILDLYRSKLKVRNTNIKKERLKKPEQKKEEAVVVKEEPKKVIEHKEEVKKQTPPEPKQEPVKKQTPPEPKQEPVKKHDPYAYATYYEIAEEVTMKEEKPAKPDPYSYIPLEEPRAETKKEEPKKEVRPTPEPVKEIKRPDENKPKEETKPKVKELPRKEEYVEVNKKVTPQRAKFRGRDVSSVRARYYEQADMDIVLRDKIATQLRENGVSETKVVPLSAKITQAVRDDVIDSNSQPTPEVTENLKEVINMHLDPILYNKVNTTDLKDYKKPSDAKHLSNLVLLRAGQIHEEIDLCKKIAEEGKKRGGKGHSPKGNSKNRSKILAINESLTKQKADNDVLRNKLKQAEQETHEVAGDKDKKQEVVQNLDSDNWNLQRDLNEADLGNHNLLAKLKVQQRELLRLDKQHQGLRNENNKLRDKMEDSENRGHTISSELLRLQSENARLKVLADQKEKEILHLKDPDQETIHQLKILSGEVTLLRTQTRRLNEEKGMLKSKSQKLETSLEESFKQKNKISIERENLEKENEELKQRYRKLALTNPPQRTLPDINSGRNGPTSRVNSRANSRSTPRAYSRNVPSNDDRRLSIAREVDEDDNYNNKK